MARLSTLSKGEWDQFDRVLNSTDLTAEEVRLLIKEPTIITAMLAEMRRPNNNSPFTAPIVYVQPEFEELKRRFPAYVNPDYKGKRFDPIERCKTVSKENREVAFEYVHMDRKASIDEVLAEMDRKGLRPALYEELLGFAEKYPYEQRKYPIFALGSGSSVDGHRYVAYLWIDVNGRNLHLDWFDGVWGGNYRFLAVRK